MNKSWSPSQLEQTGNLLKQARLVWRLLHDRRVPAWVKLIPIAGLIYLLWPIDLISDLMLPGLGEVDDLAVILIALKMFLDLSPQAVVREHLQNPLGRQAKTRSAGPAETIDASYRVLDVTKEKA